MASTLRRSGAGWAFDHNMELDHIKVHGGWKSDAIWRYLIRTPAAAGTVVAIIKVYEILSEKLTTVAPLQ